MGPAAALNAGAAWRVQGDSTYSTATNYTWAVMSANDLEVEFRPVAGWNLPTADQTITVVPGQIVRGKSFYTVKSPVLVVDESSGIGIMGTTGTVYRIESRSSLTFGDSRPWSTNTIFSNGVYLICLTQPQTKGKVVTALCGWQSEISVNGINPILKT
jgi:hypothetical protein